MKYSRLGHHQCCCCCCYWPCSLTFVLLFLLATCVLNVTVTAQSLTTTAAIKYNHQQQKQIEIETKQQKAEKEEEEEQQQRQQLQLLQQYQQSTHKKVEGKEEEEAKIQKQNNNKNNNNNDDRINVDDNVTNVAANVAVDGKNENETNEKITGTSSQSAMKITSVDENFDYKRRSSNKTNVIAKKATKNKTTNEKLKYKQQQFQDENSHRKGNKQFNFNEKVTKLTMKSKMNVKSTTISRSFKAEGIAPATITTTIRIPMMSKPSDFSKAQTTRKVMSPIITNHSRAISRTKGMMTTATTKRKAATATATATATMPTSTSATLVSSMTSPAIIGEMKMELSNRATPVPVVTIKITTTTIPPAKITKTRTLKKREMNTKIVFETAATTTTKIATAATYGEMERKHTNENDKGDERNYDYVYYDDNEVGINSNSHRRRNRKNKNRQEMLKAKETEIESATDAKKMLSQQQNFTGQKPQIRNTAEEHFSKINAYTNIDLVIDTETVTDKHSRLLRVPQQKTTSLTNIPPHVVQRRGSEKSKSNSNSTTNFWSSNHHTTPSTLLQLMSQNHEENTFTIARIQHNAPSMPYNTYTLPYDYAHNYNKIYVQKQIGRRGRREEPPKDEKVDKCRAFLESDDNKNVIHSPDFPNNYPKNINCTRVITAPKGHIIRLDFRNSFHIEAKEDCKFDYLEIRDGQYGFSNLIGKYCGTDFPPEITSKERYLWLYFHSDESIEYSGFTAVYEFMERSRETPSTDLNCTIERNGYEGWVNSSDIPKDIKKRAEETKIPLDCMWRIEVNDTWKIQLKFLEFKLVRPNDCDANFLDIFPEETTMPLRVKNFCGSAGEGIPSDSNIVHIRFYAEPSTTNSNFSILFTAFRDRGSATSCEEDEFDCQDSTCISDTLVCNDRDNCKFRWDEDSCKKNKATDSSEIVIIIIVFGLILGGMILTFLVNCIRKIMRDQKIIREHIRQSKESKLDQISRLSKARSRDNISMAMSPRQKHSETSLHILDDVSQRDYYGVAEISVHSNKTLDIRDKEHQLQHQHSHHSHHQQQQQQIERERSRERGEREHIIMRHDTDVQTSLCEDEGNNDDVDSMATGNDLVMPAAGKAAAQAYRSDMGCQTRESLFATELLRQKSVASSEGGLGSTNVISSGRAGMQGVVAASKVKIPQPHFSTFGYDTASTASGTLGRPGGTNKHHQATTLRHSIRAPPLPTASIAGSIESEQMQQQPVMSTIRSHDACHHHHRHHMAAHANEPAIEQAMEPRFHIQIQAQALPQQQQQIPQQTPSLQHQHQHQHQYHHHTPHQHKTKVIIPPLTPVAPSPATATTTPLTVLPAAATAAAATTKPQKQKSDDSKSAYIDRNSAPDVIIMTSH